MAQYYIGIDPGFGGALAALDVVNHRATVFDIPVLTVERGGSDKHEYNLVGAVGLVSAFMDHAMAVVEKVTPMPQVKCPKCFPGPRPPRVASPGANFHMGRGSMLWEATLTCARIPFRMVPPQTWKARYGIHGEKDNARLAALARFPEVADQLKRKKDNGRADALWIALYACEVLGGVAYGGTVATKGVTDGDEWAAQF